MRHWNASEEDFTGLFLLSSEAGGAAFAWGGGNGGLNAATRHSFLVAEDTVTLGGTEMFRIEFNQSTFFNDLNVTGTSYLENITGNKLALGSAGSFAEGRIIHASNEETTAGATYAMNFLSSLNPSNNKSGVSYGMFGAVNTKTGNTLNITGKMVGAGTVLSSAGSGIHSDIRGFESDIFTIAGNITNAYNYYSKTPSLALQTITNATGFYHQGWGAGVTNAYGVYINADKSYFGDDVKIDGDLNVTDNVFSENLTVNNIFPKDDNLTFYTPLGGFWEVKDVDIGAFGAFIPTLFPTTQNGFVLGGMEGTVYITQEVSGSSKLIFGKKATSFTNNFNMFYDDSKPGILNLAGAGENEDGLFDIDLSVKVSGGLNVTGNTILGSPSNIQNITMFSNPSGNVGCCGMLDDFSIKCSAGACS